MSLIMGLDGGYDPDAAAFFTRVETAAGAAPDEARRKLYNDLIVALKAPVGSDPSLWSEIRHLAIQAAANVETAMLDIKGNFNLVPQGSGTFVTDRGWSPNFSSALKTGFIPSVQISDVTDFGIGEWIRGSVTPQAAPAFGCNDGTNFLQVYPLVNTDDQTVAAMNKTAGGTWRFGTSTGSLTSPFTVAQRDNNNAEVYRNGSSLTRTGSTEGSDGLPTVEVYFAGQNNNGAVQDYSGQVMVTLLTTRMTSAQQTALDTALRAFVTGVGAL